MELSLICAVVVIIGLIFEYFLRQLKVGNYESRYILITGCDSGFGHDFAKRADALGFNVFACCLTKTAAQKFKDTSSQKLVALEMDVSKDASIEKSLEIVNRTLPEGKGLWAIVNNAGILGGIGSTHLHTRQDYENTLSVNLYGVIMVTKAFMPLVLTEKGRIVNTSSCLGRIALLNSSYCISKYGVEAFSDVLRRELYRTGVKVQLIEPGAFKTPIFGRDYIRKMAENKVASLPADVKSDLPEDAVDQLVGSIRRLEETGSTNTQIVVDAYLHAVTALFPLKRYMVGNDSKYAYRLLSILPECISDFYVDLRDARSI
ncbi:17-beta-hydroxysteroid dehydrogenase type 6-like [Ruditapes philippinarum]|uniref:17-beta-hydroxysteroid dehydrogenase type 6-like n=1 Tax=Ruditapes philippinarum TaxID=129788 RepID=UPI00295B57FC|nr:17-beta-hydroxysteroid dehydrogenase type 6-like [Ruditapes philippinarum]